MNLNEALGPKQKTLKTEDLGPTAADVGLHCLGGSRLGAGGTKLHRLALHLPFYCTRDSHVFIVLHSLLSIATTVFGKGAEV